MRALEAGAEKLRLLDCGLEVEVVEGSGTNLMRELSICIEGMRRVPPRVR